MFVSWCGDGGLWARCLFACWKICKWPRSGKSHSKSFWNVRRCWKFKCGAMGWNCKFYMSPQCVGSFTNGISLLFQLTPGLCVELHNMGYSYYPKSPMVIVICPLNALIECHMKQLEHRGISCTCLSGHNADDAFAGRYSFIFANSEALILNEKWRKMLQTPVYQK